MTVRFTKMHGAGNDFILIDDRAGQMPTDRATLAVLAARRTGIGCEGVILVQTSAVADFRMRFFNPDGGEAELCGNGARCVAAFAREIGAVAGPAMRFETLAGEVRAEVLDAATVKVWMPTPKDLRTDFVNSGVPHKVVPVADLAATDVVGEGRRIRYSDEFAPAGTNVDFVAYAPPHDAAMRTYERSPARAARARSRRRSSASRSTGSRSPSASARPRDTSSSSTARARRTAALRTSRSRARWRRSSRAHAKSETGG